MKIERMRSEKNPVFVQIIENVPFTLGDWTEIPLGNLQMPIRIQRLSFLIETNQLIGFFHLTLRIKRSNEEVYLSDHLSLSTSSGRIVSNFIVNVGYREFEVQGLPVYIEPLPDLGLLDFEALEILIEEVTTRPTQINMYLGWTWK